MSIINTVLEHLKTIEPLEQISLKKLTIKLAMLLLLATGQRGQSIYLLSLEGMAMRANSCTFELMEHIKSQIRAQNLLKSGLFNLTKPCAH